MSQKMMQKLLEDLAATSPRRGEWEGIESEDQIAPIILSAIEASHSEGVEPCGVAWAGLRCSRRNRRAWLGNRPTPLPGGGGDEPPPLSLPVRARCTSGVVGLNSLS